MAIWKLRVEEVSQIDAGGNIEVRFALIAPNALVVWNDRKVNGPPSTIQERAEVIAADWIREYKRSLLIQVGTEVGLNDADL